MAHFYKSPEHGNECDVKVLSPGIEYCSVCKCLTLFVDILDTYMKVDRECGYFEGLWACIYGVSMAVKDANPSFDIKWVSAKVGHLGNWIIPFELVKKLEEIR
jgi:hypothetical protein